MTICKNCSAVMEDNAKFCDNCGHPMNAGVQNPPIRPQKNFSPSKQPQKKKTNGCLIAVIITLAVFFVLGFLVIIVPAIIGSHARKAENKAVNNQLQTQQYSETEDQIISDEEVTTPEKEETEAQYKKKCKKANYKTIARDVNGKEGEYFTFTGEIIQELDGTYRMNITKNEYGNYEDTILFTAYITDKRILEGDIVTIWGVSTGLYTYTAALGQEVTVPSIDAKYVKINN